MDACAKLLEIGVQGKERKQITWNAERGGNSKDLDSEKNKFGEDKIWRDTQKAKLPYKELNY